MATSGGAGQAQIGTPPAPGTSAFRALRIAVVIPAYNEARWIESTLHAVPWWVERVIVVDDASSDDTARRVSRFAAEDRAGRVQLTTHADNRGVGASIVTGYQDALERGAEVCVVMAGDNQMDPLDLPALLEPIARGRADYVKGNRYAHAEHEAIPRLRRLGGDVLSWWTRWATGLSVTDTQCGYTAITRAALQRLPLADVWPRYGYPNDLLGMLSQHGMRVEEVPVRPVYAGQASGLRAYHVLQILGLILRRKLRGLRQPTPPLLRFPSRRSGNTAPS